MPAAQPAGQPQPGPAPAKAKVKAKTTARKTSRKKTASRKKTTKKRQSSAIQPTGGPVKAVPTPNARNGGGVAMTQPGFQGFRTNFSPIIGKAIVEKVQKGVPFTFAGHLLRVPQGTVSGWLAQGEEDPEGTFGEFAADVREAQALFVEEAILNIKEAGVGDAKQWAALMTLLERIYPESFKRPGERTTNVNVNVGVGLVEQRLHKMHEEGEIVYDGG